MSARCEVLPGDGTVARRGDNLLWASADTSEAALAGLLACLDLREPTHAGARVVLAALAAGLSDDDGTFALLISDGTHGRTLCRGVPLQVAGRPVAADHELLVLDGIVQSGTGEPATAAHHDLRDGSVPGGGFRWTPEHLTLATEPSADPEPGTESEPVVAAEPVPAEPVVPAEPTPAAPVVLAKPERPAESAPMTAAFDPMVTTGSLVFEDGTAIVLDADLVLGRRPEQHELVTSGAAAARVISDPEHVLSGAHAAVRSQAGAVWVTDLESLNGTHVAAPDARDWTKLAPGEPFQLTEGHRVLLGWTVLTFHAGQL